MPFPNSAGFSVCPICRTEKPYVHSNQSQVAKTAVAPPEKAAFSSARAPCGACVTGQGFGPPFPGPKDLVPHPPPTGRRQGVGLADQQGRRFGRGLLVCQMFLTLSQYYNVLPHLRDLSKSPSLSTNSSRSLNHFCCASPAL